MCPHPPGACATISSICASIIRSRLLLSCPSAIASATTVCSSRSPAPAFPWCPATATTSPAARRMPCSPKRTSSRQPCSTKSAPDSTASRWAFFSRILGTTSTARWGCRRFPPTRAISDSPPSRSPDSRGLVEICGNPTNPRDFGLTSISVTGFSPLGDESNNPQHGVTNVYQLTDNLTWVHGRHLAKFGADFRVLQQNAYRDVESRGFIDFLGLFTGNALEELLLGLATDSGVATLNNPEHLRTYSYNFFANDTWRLRPNLTLILGVRYEYNSPGVDAQNHANLYDQATQTLVPVGTGGMPRGGYLPDRNNFAPRLGLAWTPAGSLRTVVRAGYGIYYDQSSLAPGEG